MGLPDDWRTSDDILDGAAAGLAFFAEFRPLYDEAAALAGRGRWRGLPAGAVRAAFDQLRGIDLGAVRADAEALRTVAEAAENHVHNLERHWAGLAGWHGEAAGAARADHERITGRAAELLRSAASGPGVLTAAATAIQDALVRYAGQVLELAADRCGGLTAGAVLAAIREPDTLALGHFVDEFDARKDAFDGYTRAAVRAVEGHYEVLLTHLRPLAEEPGTLAVSPDGSTLAVSTSDGRLRLTLRGAAGAAAYELDLGATAASSAEADFGDTARLADAPGLEPPAARLPSTLAPWAIRPVERLRPDEDGKIVIHNGRVTITMDPDEDADELTVTLEDGDGHTSTYRLDYRDPANPTLRRAAEGGRLAAVRELGRPR